MTSAKGAIIFEQRKKVTIQDIADSLGLSRNTVSKALNNNPSIPDETRSKVIRKAIDMNYKQFALFEQEGTPAKNRQYRPAYCKYAEQFTFLARHC
ncbi:LacI family DNA-binding transcriptional regulator [Paenibacillus rhizoplanae]